MRASRSRSAPRARARLCATGVGHPRSDHTHVFVRGVQVGCNRRIGDFQTGTSRSCGCEGFRPILGGLSEAGFAVASHEDDAPIAPLRSALPRTKEHLA